MKAIIIDDEPNNIKNLRLILSEHCPEVECVDAANNATDGRRIIRLHKPDIVFLDIQMPGETGFELLQSLSDRCFEVVFVTGFDQYGIQAVKFSAIDYLLKPIAVQELKDAVLKAGQKIAHKKHNERLENLLEFMQQKDNRKEHKIALTSTREIRFVNPADIVYCEASNNYTIFHLSSSEKLTISKPLFEYDELLTDYGFIRCHNSYLINKSYVKSIIREKGDILLMETGNQIPVSRQKREITYESLRTLYKNM